VVIGACFVIAALDQLTRARPRLWLAGALAGLAYLARVEMLLGSALLALFALRSARFKGLLGFAAGFAVLTVPWAMHQWTVIGTPFFNLSSYNLISSWGRYPEFSALRDFALTPDRFPAALRAALPTLWQKWLAFLPHAAKHELSSPSAGTGWLALVGILALAASARDATARAHFASWRGTSNEVGPTHGQTLDFATVALALALIPMLTSTIAVYQVLYMVTFMPICAIGAAVGARFLAERLGVPRLWPAALMILMLPSVALTLRSASRESRALSRQLADERAALAPLRGGRTSGVVFSDTPDFVAWTTGRPTIWLTRDEFFRLYERGPTGTRAAGFGLPPRAQVETWFHDDSRSPGARGQSLPTGTP
jgi:hypothetical protein